MEPRLIKEIRDTNGGPVRFGRPRVIRRVVPDHLARALTPVLVDVVDNGTGTRARMSYFMVAGKSGTARATGGDGRYEDPAYHASFGAHFPAEDPQVLFFVKLDRPSGIYYGGATAAPLTLATLERLLSARQSPIDRRALARAQRERFEPRATTPVVRFAAATDQPEADPWAEPAEPGETDPASVLSPEMIVPELEGAPVRVALRRLHKMGLRIELQGSGTVSATAPAAGRPIAAGDTIVVMGRGR